MKALKLTEGLEDQYKLLLLQIKFKQVEYRDLNSLYKDELEQLGIDIDESETNKVEINEEINDEEQNRIAMEERIQLEEMEYVYNDDDEDIPDDALIASE